DTEAGFGLCHAICDGKAADLQRQKASLPELKWLRKPSSFDSPFQFAFCRTTWYSNYIYGLSSESAILSPIRSLLFKHTRKASPWTNPFVRPGLSPYGAWVTGKPF